MLDDKKISDSLNEVIDTLLVKAVRLKNLSLKESETISIDLLDLPEFVSEPDKSNKKRRLYSEQLQAMFPSVATEKRSGVYISDLTYKKYCRELQRPKQ